MCTVSFVQVKDTVIITSNRDEHQLRENADAPNLFVLGEKKVVYPRDARAGGTWFAAGDDGVVAVLLNGAFIKHLPAPPYRKSRGLILLEIVSAAEPLPYFQLLDLHQIEPFTVVLYQPGLLHELRWDGKIKHHAKLDLQGRYIWSSATLYTDEVINRRRDMFYRFLEASATLTPEAIRDFHAHNNGDQENGFIISRQSGMKTFSITQAVVQDARVSFSHTDLLQQMHHTEILPLNPSAIKT